MKSVSSKLKTSDSIVLDMRGNTGGDDRVGMELTTLLFGHPYEHPIKQQISFQTPVALALQVNRWKADEFYYIREKLKVPEYLIETLSQANMLSLVSSGIIMLKKLGKIPSELFIFQIQALLFFPIVELEWISPLSLVSFMTKDLLKELDLPLT